MYYQVKSFEELVDLNKEEELSEKGDSGDLIEVEEGSRNNSKFPAHACYLKGLINKALGNNDEVKKVRIFEKII